MPTDNSNDDVVGLPKPIQLVSYDDASLEDYVALAYEPIVDRRVAGRPRLRMGDGVTPGGIAIAGSGGGNVETPHILAPVNGAVDIDSNADITASPFVGLLANQQIDRHAFSNWEIATDITFDNVVYSAVRTTGNKNILPLDNITEIVGSTTYYVRVQYSSYSGGVSEWSNYSQFTTGVISSGGPGGGNTPGGSTLQVLTHETPTAGHMYGTGILVNRDELLISNPYPDSPQSDAGISVYKKVGGSWVFQYETPFSNQLPGLLQGYTMAVKQGATPEEDVILVGCPRDSYTNDGYFTTATYSHLRVLEKQLINGTHQWVDVAIVDRPTGYGGFTPETNDQHGYGWGVSYTGDGFLASAPYALGQGGLDTISYELRSQPVGPDAITWGVKNTTYQAYDYGDALGSVFYGNVGFHVLASQPKEHWDGSMLPGYFIYTSVIPGNPAYGYSGNMSMLASDLRNDGYNSGATLTPPTAKPDAYAPKSFCEANGLLVAGDSVNGNVYLINVSSNTQVDVFGDINMGGGDIGATGIGWSVFISHDGNEYTLAIGSVEHTVNGVANAGAVWVYTGDVGNWTFQKQYVSDNPASGELFGDAIQITAEDTIITAPGNNEHGTGVGKVYVFK